jgi:hypothetical protein
VVGVYLSHSYRVYLSYKKWGRWKHVIQTNTASFSILTETARSITSCKSSHFIPFLLVYRAPCFNQILVTNQLPPCLCQVPEECAKGVVTRKHSLSTVRWYRLHLGSKSRGNSLLWDVYQQTSLGHWLFRNQLLLYTLPT